MIFPLDAFEAVEAYCRRGRLLNFRLLRESRYVLVVCTCGALLPIITVFGAFVFGPLLSRGNEDRQFAWVIIPSFSCLDAFLYNGSRVFGFYFWLSTI